jgi:uncharacterized protein YodC (DUF2158 family)
MNFQVGEVVKLKSGSPWMTVVEIGDNGWVSCYWFTADGKNKRESGSFPPTSLEKK